jgi:hypothetical protein
VSVVAPRKDPIRHLVGLVISTSLASSCGESKRVNSDEPLIEAVPTGAVQVHNPFFPAQDVSDCPRPHSKPQASLWVFGRLAPLVPLAKASAELATIASRLDRSFPPPTHDSESWTNRAPMECEVACRDRRRGQHPAAVRVDRHRARGDSGPDPTNGAERRLPPSARRSHRRARFWSAGRAIVRAYLEVDLRVIDPWMLFVVPPPPFMAAFGACYLPARRAASLNPNAALRHD